MRLWAGIWRVVTLSEDRGLSRERAMIYVISFGLGWM